MEQYIVSIFRLGVAISQFAIVKIYGSEAAIEDELGRLEYVFDQVLVERKKQKRA